MRWPGSRAFAVEYAEPNWIYTHDATSNDTYYTNGSLWGMYGDATTANQYGSQAGEAWAAGKTCDSSVYVGIIDEGYMYMHEDLAASAGTNPGETASNGVDDDGNGYVDDVYGWDFDGNNNTVFDGAGDDHGTHVAGTIGGTGGKSKGVAGVCWSVKLLNAKFLGNRGGTTANAIGGGLPHGPEDTPRINLVATNNSGRRRLLAGAQGRDRPLRGCKSCSSRPRAMAATTASATTTTQRRTTVDPREREHHRGRSITSSGAKSSFELRLDDRGSRRTRFEHRVDRARPAAGGKTATISSGYATYSGTLDGHAARDRRSRALCFDPPRRYSGAVKPPFSAARCRRPRSLESASPADA
jgi:hypothetical protein